MGLSIRRSAAEETEVEEIWEFSCPLPEQPVNIMPDSKITPMRAANFLGVFIS